MHETYCFSDIHGMYDLYKAIMDYCQEQDPEATIVFCGDAIDRGPDGYKIMNELLDNPYVIYLKGNHEDMFVKAAREIKKYFDFSHKDVEKIHKVLNACKHYDYKYAGIQDSLYNGGLSTLTDWILDGMPMDIVKQVENLPLTFCTETCDFCHSATIYRTFKDIADAEYEALEPDPFSVEGLLWGRSGLNWGWTAGRTVVFGHTPVQFLPDYIDIKLDEKNIVPVKYYGGKNKMLRSEVFTGAKIDMDTGTVFTGRAFVLNILTMKAYGFELKDNKIEKIEVIQF